MLERWGWKPQPDQDLREGSWSLHSCLEVFLPCFAVASHLPFDSCLFCVAFNKGEAAYEEGRTLKRCGVSCAALLSLRLALCISACDPEVPQMLCQCFCCGNRSVKRWDGALPQQAVFVFCCCFCAFVALGCSIWILQKSETLVNSSPFYFFPQSPTPFLLHFSGNNLFLAFPSPSGLRYKIPPRSRGVLWRQCNSLYSQSQLQALWGNLGPSSPPSLFLTPPSSFRLSPYPDRSGSQQGVIVYKKATSLKGVGLLSILTGATAVYQHNLHQFAKAFYNSCHKMTRDLCSHCRKKWKKVRRDNNINLQLECYGILMNL